MSEIPMAYVFIFLFLLLILQTGLQLFLSSIFFADEKFLEILGQPGNQWMWC
jgi:hypothetical protein